MEPEIPGDGDVHVTSTHTMLKKCTLDGFCKLDLDLKTVLQRLTCFA